MEPRYLFIFSHDWLGYLTTRNTKYQVPNSTTQEPDSYVALSILLFSPSPQNGQGWYSLHLADLKNALVALASSSCFPIKSFLPICSIPWKETKKNAVTQLWNFCCLPLIIWLFQDANIHGVGNGVRKRMGFNQHACSHNCDILSPLPFSLFPADTLFWEDNLLGNFCQEKVSPPKISQPDWNFSVLQSQDIWRCHIRNGFSNV